jgi:hypothetical protein
MEAQQRPLNIGRQALDMIRDERHVLNVVAAFSKYFRTDVARPERNGATPYTYLQLWPEREIAEKFSLTREVLCYVDETTRLDSRSFEAVDSLIAKLRTRIVDDVLFFISAAPNAEALCDEYMERTGRKVIRTTPQAVNAASEDFSYELLRQFLYSRDFFDVRDPVSSDAQFFARYKLVDEIYDNLAAGYNCGIFGLRKIGKTSVIERVLKRNDLSQKFRVAWIDAQAPEIYKNSAAGVVLEIVREFNRHWARNTPSATPFKRDIPRELPVVEASRYFRDFIQSLSGQGKPLLVVVDELERILPSRLRLSHWNTDYLDLWRLLRSVSQTMDGKFVFLVASTNPYFVESARVETEDNPLYQFLRVKYLPMFSHSDLRTMLTKLGKPMGIAFDDDALSLIHSEFGGHPFLSRQLCSAIAKDLGERPLTVEGRNVEVSILKHRGSFRADLDAILKIFSDFYPEEYALLSVLNNDERKALRQLEEQPLAARHLEGYGLLARTRNSFRFTMAAVPPYLTSTPLSEFKQADIPDMARERHAVLQRHLNTIEPTLRSIVMTQFKLQFEKEWQSKLLEYSSPDVQSRIEGRGELTVQEFLEEFYVRDFVAAINANWKLFERIFKNRTEFKEQSRQLTDVSRGASDHRKFSLCANDAQYVKAHDAVIWFADKLG